MEQVMVKTKVKKKKAAQVNIRNEPSGQNTISESVEIGKEPGVEAGQSLEEADSAEEVLPNVEEENNPTLRVNCEEIEDKLDKESTKSIVDNTADILPNEFSRLMMENRKLFSEISQEQSKETNEDVKVQQSKFIIKPYTESQLGALYTNTELDMLEQFTQQYVEAELKGLAVKQHPLYELLANYVQVRTKITGNTLELNQLRKEYADLQVTLWTTDISTATGRAECQDGTQVTATHSYQKATFHHSVFQCISRVLGMIRKLTYENHVLYSYMAEDIRLQIELYIQTAIANCINISRLDKNAAVILSLQNEPLHTKPYLSEVRLCISVLFAFQRKLIRDVQFFKESREWLSRLVALLLRLATYQDHLFILSHILRCPAGCGSWASSFIQTPLEEIIESPFSSYQINHILAVFNVLLSTVSERERFLEDVSQSRDGESLWIVVDSDGEEDEESGNSLRENDLVSLLIQLPFENLFRSLLLIQKKNFENVYDASKITDHHLLRFLAFETVLLKIINKGLHTYNHSKYNQFSKRLSRLIRHTVQYATDLWEDFLRKTSIKDGAMLERLQIEYDAFFLRAIFYLYTSQKLGAWQFLAVIPYNLITTETIWKIFWFLHDSDASANEILNPTVEQNYAQKFRSTSFRDQFEEKLTTLADDELYYLLNTFANMALARERKDEDFIKAAAIDLLQVGFISKTTQDICSKPARTLLTHIASKYPDFLSLILKQCKEHMETIGSLVLYLYEELPLTIWKFNDTDLSIISGLLQNQLNSVESKWGRMILSRLNWDLLPYDIHCDVALLVVKITEQEPGYVQWGWQTIQRLKLHINDKLCKDFNRILDPDNYDSIIKGVHQQHPLACFVAVLMTSWGHLIPMICSQGLSQLLLLQLHQKHEAVLFALSLMVPLFINSQEYIINNEKFQEIVTNLINADRSYISMAKSFISTQSTVLQQFGNMIETQIVNFASYDQESPRCLVRLWINTLVSIQNWNRDSGILYLLDTIIKAAFFYQDALQAASEIFKDLVQAQTAQEQSGISSLFKWVSSNNANNTSLISATLSNCTWLAYLIFELEHEDREKRTGLWRELLSQLNSQKGKVNVDAALKKAASVVKVPVITSGSLCIYRWAQQAMDAPADHPLLPLLWQKFFTLYLTRIPVAHSADRSCVGEKFFDGLVNFQFLKRIKRKLQEILDCYEAKLKEWSEEDDRSRKVFLENCISIYRAFNLWLEEPRLQQNDLLLPSLPLLYHPTLLAYIIQGSNTPWYEYVDYERIKSEQFECIKMWKSSNFRFENNINKPLLNPGKSMESSDPVERILRRLAVYETPKPPPEMKNYAPVVPVVDFSTKDSFFNSLEPCFKTLNQFAHNQTLKLSEHKALDCSYQELVPQLYRSVLNKVTKKVPCKGRNDTVNCSGAAVIVLEMHEARVNDRIDHQIQTNRNAYESILTKALIAPAASLCTASVTIQQALKVLQMQVRCNPASAELGSELFYYILSQLSEETLSYLPTKTLFSSCIEKLGQSHICAVEYEMPRLLEKILKEPDLGMYLAPHFSPINVGTSSILHMYATITKEIGNSYDTALALLSKFEIDKWLQAKEPKLSQRTEFMQCVIKALTILGFDPPIEALMLHGMYRKHLLTIFEFQFPEQYGEVLINLLKASNGSDDSSLLAKSVWLDILNCLSKPMQMNPKLPLRDQLRQYAQIQQMLQHQELLETAELFSKHFTQERLQYGLYGLYPKCRNYIDIYAVLLGMAGHGLIISSLNTHQGLLGDKLVQKIWPYLVNIFAPWIVPYSMKNLKDNMASWIQQLADDRSILLPWIPSDGPLAQKIIAVFYECVHYLIHTLPASGNILCFLWQWYVTCYAHTAVKDHILGPIHHTFMAFPWDHFWPSLNDLECMLRVIDQYLPECHSFLGHIFISVPWSPWLNNFKSSPPQVKARVYQCFINLLVKLSNEPNVRHKHCDKAKSLLVESETFEWNILEPVHFHNIMDWYVMSCDPSVIFKEDPLDLDFRVLHFLRTVSGYSNPLENPTTDTLNKRLIYVKSYVKLWSVYMNKNKSTVSTKENQIKSVIINELIYLEKMVKTSAELNLILGEFLTLANIDSIGSFIINSFIKWTANKMGDDLVIKALLQISGTCIGDVSILASLLEHLISVYFTNASSTFNPSWNDLSQILIVTSSKQAELEQVVLNQSNILVLNALFIQRINKSVETERLLSGAVDWIENIKISESIESKIPLLWFGILKLALIQCEDNESTAGAVLYKFAKILLHISEDKGGSRWGRGLLNVIRISKSDSISISFRFLCRALAGYVLAQLPEMKGEPQVVRHEINAPARVGQTGGNTECAKILMSLDLGQSQGKIKECEALALKQIQDSGNSLHNVSKFLQLLLKQFYIKPYFREC